MVVSIKSIPLFPPFVFVLINAKVKPIITTATNGINLTAVTTQF
jgi:hypothetical protein